MTVLQVASSLHDWGGIERYITYLAQGLTARNHEVMVTCPPKSPLWQRIPAGRVAVTMRGKFSPASAVPYLRLFRSRRFDVVHVHFSPDFYMPAWAARVTRQPLVVMTRHVALPWNGHKVRMYSRLYDKFIAVSKAVEKKLVESGVDTGKVRVAYAGVPSLKSSQPREDTRKELGLTDDDMAYGFFGRLTQEKGVSVLAEAAQSLRTGSSIQVFGAGPLSGTLKATPSFVLRGYVPDVANFMSAMDAVVVPSVWEEAFPYSVLEAMSLGKAVVASDVGGLPELVSPGNTGLLVPKSDPAALADALNGLDRDQLTGMGSQALRIQQAEYTIPKMAERIENVYKTATN